LPGRAPQAGRIAARLRRVTNVGQQSVMQSSAAHALVTERGVGSSSVALRDDGDRQLQRSRPRRTAGPVTLAAPYGTSVAPAVPVDCEDAAGLAPAVGRAQSSVAASWSRHSPVRVPTVPVAPAAEESQREDPRKQSLHVVSSLLNLAGRCEAVVTERST
jgi:hypothetical protein